MDCPLCRSTPESYATGKEGREYLRCPKCDLVFLDARFRLEAPIERERYLLHRNDPENPGFAAYLNSFVDFALSDRLPRGASILDYGSGPIPALAGILGAKGFEVSLYDPFFGPTTLPDRSFDACVMHETIEHFDDVRGELERGIARVRDSGILAVRTGFRPETREAFLGWWYRQDTTHKAFFSLKAFRYVASVFEMRLVAENGKDIVVFKKA